MFDKKYTKEEFKEFYKIKMKQVIEKLENDYKETAKEHGEDDTEIVLGTMVHTMRCMMALIEMEQALFDEE